MCDYSLQHVASRPAVVPRIAMPVNYVVPSEESLYPVAGIRLGAAQAGIRKPNRYDLLLVEIAAGARAAGVFTQNRFCAAPVLVAIPAALLVMRGYPLVLRQLTRLAGRRRGVVMIVGFARGGASSADRRHRLVACDHRLDPIA